MVTQPRAEQGGLASHLQSPPGSWALYTELLFPPHSAKGSRRSKLHKGVDVPMGTGSAKVRGVLARVCCLCPQLCYVLLSPALHCP